jgi:hypothetical protein
LSQVATETRNPLICLHSTKGEIAFGMDAALTLAFLNWEINCRSVFTAEMHGNRKMADEIAKIAASQLAGSIAREIRISELERLDAYGREVER